MRVHKPFPMHILGSVVEYCEGCTLVTLINCGRNTEKHRGELSEMRDLLNAPEAGTLREWIGRFQGSAQICSECEEDLDRNCRPEDLSYGQAFFLTTSEQRLFRWVFPLCGICVDQLLSHGEAGVPNLMDTIKEDIACSEPD